jgi:hypothetical protein
VGNVVPFHKPRRLTPELANDEDCGFKRQSEMCAARPLRTPFIEDGIRQVESMYKEDTDGE